MRLEIDDGIVPLNKLLLRYLQERRFQAAELDARLAHSNDNADNTPIDDGIDPFM